MFKKLNLLLAASLASASVFAAYGPAPAAPAASSSNWTIGVGYGQMFSMKKTTTGQSTSSFDKPTLLEVDLFHNNGFGAVYMTSAKKKGYIIGTGNPTGEYSFNGYFLGYQKGLAANMTGRVLVGLSDQKMHNTIYKSSGKFAFGASGAYNMNLSGKLNGFAELGYLNQKKFQFDGTNYASGTGFYWKLGVKMPI